MGQNASRSRNRQACTLAMPAPESFPKRLYYGMPSPRFEVIAPFQPAGDQPKAIAELLAGRPRGERDQTLVGVTRAGQTL
jgi:excinuclease ABC subunit B